MDAREIDKKIGELEKEKGEYIDRLKKLNSKLREKRMKAKAYSPYLKGKEDMVTGPLKRKIRGLEFRISTEAFDRHREAEIIKEIKKLEAELAKAKEVEKRRRGKELAQGDVGQIQKKISEIEEKVAPIREELKELYSLSRKVRGKQARKARERKEYTPYLKKNQKLTLEDIVEIERA